MAKRVQHIRHTSSGADAFVGLEGELTVDLTGQELRVHNGLTAGGVGTARKDLANVSVATTSVAGKMSAAQVVALETASDNIVDVNAALAAEILNRIDDVDEEEARAVAAESTLNTALTAETASRSSADLDLAGRITTEQSARISGDNNLQSQINALSGDYTGIFNLIYPVGTIYSSIAATSPNTLFGVGTWVAIRGKMLISEDGTSGFTAGDTGGSKNAVVVAHTHAQALTIDNAGAHAHKLYHLNAGGGVSNTYITDIVTAVNNRQLSAIDTTDAEPAHSHGVSGSITAAGVSGVNANLPPYHCCYMWRRTA